MTTVIHSVRLVDDGAASRARVSLVDGRTAYVGTADRATGSVRGPTG